VPLADLTYQRLMDIRKFARLPELSRSRIEAV
jgi:hypothetical protein